MWRPAVPAEASIAVKLQVSPTDDSSFFIDDTPTAVTLGTDAATVLVPKNYLHYTRLWYQNTYTGATANTATIVAYYDARE
jgi:hypothetical protein